MELVESDLRRFPRGRLGDREISVDEQERKTFSLGFCGLIVKYWLCRQFCHFKFYYYITNLGSD
jgi:hypothetical protein